jgi:hypothetical protein
VAFAPGHHVDIDHRRRERDMDMTTQMARKHQQVWQCDRMLAQVRRHLARLPDDPALRAAERAAIEAVRDARRQAERARAGNGVEVVATHRSGRLH